MKATGRIKQASRDFLTGKFLLTLELDFDVTAEIEDLKEKDFLDVKVNELKKTRSLAANAFFWEILGRLSNIHETTSMELHDSMVFERSIPFLDENGEPQTVILQDGVNPNEREKRTDGAKRRYYKQIAVIPREGFPSLVGWMRIKGTSDFDTKEMGQLLDDVLNEAKNNGINLEPPEEALYYLRIWQKDCGRF